MDTDAGKGDWLSHQVLGRILQQYFFPSRIRAEYKSFPQKKESSSCWGNQSRGVRRLSCGQANLKADCKPMPVNKILGFYGDHRPMEEGLVPQNQPYMHIRVSLMV